MKTKSQYSLYTLVCVWSQLYYMFYLIIPMYSTYMASLTSDVRLALSSHAPAHGWFNTHTASSKPP